MKNNEFGVLTANFTIPKPSKNNIRMSRSLGGGALNDLGIYASTSGYLFWEEKLKNIKISEYKKIIKHGFYCLGKLWKRQRL